MPAKMKIRSAYAALPAAERKVADFILKDPDRASLMVINEIAEGAGVSVPSVTRLARKLGYVGFLDFRVALATGSSSIESLKSTPIMEGDTDEIVAEKTILATMRAMEDTLKTINRSALAELACRMAEGKRIFVLGLNHSGSLAKDFSRQLNCMGCDATPLLDQNMMQRFAPRIGKGDVCIGISRTGRTKCTLDALAAAKKNGAYCAFITSYINSPAALLADSFFCTSRVEDMKQQLGWEPSLTIRMLTGVLLVLLSRHISPYNRD